jgi:hypothetical protein
MTRTIHAALGAAMLLGLGLIAPATAQTRVFVAAQGSDGNPCTFAAPCRTFQHAHDTVTAGGEIDVLDPAGYGAVTISKPISIQGHGFSGVSVGTGATGIVINAAAGNVVNLSGLIIEGSGVGSIGIQFNTGKTLTIQNTFVRNLTTDGIRFFPNQSTASSLVVKDTLVANVGITGIVIQPSGGGAVSTIFNRVESNNNANGIFLDGEFTAAAMTATATDCVAFGNSNVGFQMNSFVSPGGRFMLVGSVASNNGTGIIAGGGATTIILGATTVTGNANGWQILSGDQLLSYEDNRIDGNGANQGPPNPISNK